MIKRPSFPVAHADPSSRRRFDQRLTVVVLVLAIIVVAGLLVRAVGPIPETPSDPNTFVVGP
jgi:hypothetical protein